MQNIHLLNWDIVYLGFVYLPQAEIYAELGEVVLGEKEAYKDQTTVFKSLGKPTVEHNLL